MSLRARQDFEEALHELIKKTVNDHKRIIFNGNGYDDAWIAEAEKRGLLNLQLNPRVPAVFLARKEYEALHFAQGLFRDRNAGKIRNSFGELLQDNQH